MACASCAVLGLLPLSVSLPLYCLSSKLSSWKSSGVSKKNRTSKINGKLEEVLVLKSEIRKSENQKSDFAEIFWIALDRKTENSSCTPSCCSFQLQTHVDPSKQGGGLRDCERECVPTRRDGDEDGGARFLGEGGEARLLPSPAREQRADHPDDARVWVRARREWFSEKQAKHHRHRDDDDDDDDDVALRLPQKRGLGPADDQAAADGVGPAPTRGSKQLTGREVSSPFSSSRCAPPPSSTARTIGRGS